MKKFFLAIFFSLVLIFSPVSPSLVTPPRVHAGIPVIDEASIAQLTVQITTMLNLLGLTGQVLDTGCKAWGAATQAILGPFGLGTWNEAFDSVATRLGVEDIFKGEGQSGQIKSGGIAGGALLGENTQDDLMRLYMEQYGVKMSQGMYVKMKDLGFIDSAAIAKSIKNGRSCDQARGGSTPDMIKTASNMIFSGACDLASGGVPGSSAAGGASGSQDSQKRSTGATGGGGATHQSAGAVVSNSGTSADRSGITHQSAGTVISGVGGVIRQGAEGNVTGVIRAGKQLLPQEMSRKVSDGQDLYNGIRTGNVSTIANTLQRLNPDKAYNAVIQGDLNIYKGITSGNAAQVLKGVNQNLGYVMKEFGNNEMGEAFEKLATPGPQLDQQTLQLIKQILATYGWYLSTNQIDSLVQCGIILPEIVLLYAPPPEERVIEIPQALPPCANLVNGVCMRGSTSVPQGDNLSLDIDTDPTSVILKLYTWFLSIAGGIALLLMLNAGEKIMWSKGKPETIQEGKEQLTAAIVGLLFIILAFVLFEQLATDLLKIPGICKDEESANCPAYVNPFGLPQPKPAAPARPVAPAADPGAIVPAGSAPAPAAPAATQPNTWDRITNTVSGWFGGGAKPADPAVVDPNTPAGGGLLGP